MTKFALGLAALAVVGTMVAAQPSTAQSVGDSSIRLAQADVSVRVGTPDHVVVRRHKRHVRSRTVIATRHGRHCRTVTVRKRHHGRVVIRKTRRCY